MVPGLIVTSSITIPSSELKFAFSRSSGPGGQNVNKVSTRVEILFDLRNSVALSEHEKSRLLTAIGRRLDTEGILRVAAQESRSQWKNRQDALEKLAALLRRGLAPRRNRVPSRPTRSSQERRAKAKILLSRKKRERSRSGRDDE